MSWRDHVECFALFLFFVFVFMLGNLSYGFNAKRFHKILPWYYLISENKFQIMNRHRKWKQIRGLSQHKETIIPRPSYLYNRNPTSRKTSYILIHWGRDKMAAIFQTTSSNAFSWMEKCKLGLLFHWSLFPRVQLIIFQYWFRQWLGAAQATSHYLNQWWRGFWRIYASLDVNE